MTVWKQASYLGMIGLMALFVGSAWAQNETRASSGQNANEKKESAQTAAKGDAKKGQTLFEANCGICHDAATEEMKVGPGMKGWFKKPPHKFRDREHAHSEDVLRDQIKNGGGQMPPMGSMVSDKEVDDLVAYIQTI